MRALALVGGFGADHLEWIDIEPPRPGAGEVSVEIRATALNFRDIHVIGGKRPNRLPLIPLSDAAGSVVAVGECVTRFAPGDRVMPTFIQNWISGPIPRTDDLATLGGPLDGAARPLAVFAQDALVRTPPGLSDIEAATLPCAALSAWNALFEAATLLRPGATVLIQGTGGVSTFALQFAKLAGARTIVISGSDEKIDRATAIGADAAINYRREPEWGRAAREIAPEGIDLVVEVAGETTFAQSIAALRNGGHISYVGFLSGTVPRFDLAEISRKALTIAGIRVGNRDSFERMVAAIAAADLHPVIDSVFDLDELPAALERLGRGEHFGKIALTVADRA